jgi:glycosyltransferase involved in cell wall biosynthesis
MKILVIAPDPPTPPYSGTRRRLLELLRSLGGGNEVDLACLVQSHADEAHLQQLTIPGVRLFAVGHDRAQFLRPVLNRWPALIERYWNPNLAECVAALVRKRRYDWTFAEECYVTPYLDGVSAPRALTAHNIEYRIFEQIAGHNGDLDESFRLTGPRREKFRHAREELPELREYERETWKRVDLCVTVSSTEHPIVAGVAGASKVYLAPNCPWRSIRVAPLKPGQPALVYIGKLNYFPNVDAIVRLVDSILPLVRKDWPEVDFVVAGREPAEELIDFCHRAGVRVVANPERIEDVVTEGSVLVSPLQFGGGTRIKVLDAFALGVPVVASELTIEGLGVRPGRECIVAGPPHEFAGAVSDLLGSRARREALAEAGREYLDTHHLQWSDTFAGLERRLRACR